MFTANPTDPSFPTIRYVSTLGPASPYPWNAGLSGYPRADSYPFDGTASASGTMRRQRGRLSAIAGVILAAGHRGGAVLRLRHSSFVHS